VGYVIREASVREQSGKAHSRRNVYNFVLENDLFPFDTFLQHRYFKNVMCGMAEIGHRFNEVSKCRVAVMKKDSKDDCG
jgi:hypothetical protein